MDLPVLERRLAAYVAGSPDNALQAEYALTDDIVGTPLFDAPLVGCARADLRAGAQEQLQRS